MDSSESTQIHDIHPPVTSQVPVTIPPQKKKGIPVALLILFLIISFIAGLLSAVWYFQDQLQKAKIPADISEQIGKQAIPKLLIIATDATALSQNLQNRRNG